jgi:hypothetical protein
MNHYDVTLQVPVNVRVSNVLAVTPEAAITAAEQAVDLHLLFDREQPAAEVTFTAYAEAIQEVLVDRVGDQEFQDSQWYNWHDHHWQPLPTKSLDRLRRLDEETATLQKELGLSSPGEVVWQADVDFRRLLVVVADGYGRASLLEVEGNYPVDYLLHEQLDFDSEEAACAAASAKVE